ncbi:trypsin-like peptidase domain-containing protein [candidate division KSB1 bacterium]|nr:trypsin-like peptidase domain-containing protein [candidate division KSB1 bacterium]
MKSSALLKYFIIGFAVGLAGILLFKGLPYREGGESPVRQPLLVKNIAAQEIQDEITASRQNAITRAVKKAGPAVVGINVTQVREYRARNPFFNDPFFRDFFPPLIYRQPIKSLGSGLLISDDGYILTNEHVVHNAVEIIVTLTDGEQYDAEPVGADFNSDIALLKIEGNDFHSLKFGNSDDIIIGEWVIAIGNPYGLFSINNEPTVTVGVVSAVNRDFGKLQNRRVYKDMIQTDASINPGNSGGPLINSLGEVIGMNTMIYSESGGSIGLGFAIPINYVKEIVDDLRERGGVNRNYWTGLSIQDVDRLIAWSLGLKSTKGVIVTDVEKGSPAEKVGVEVADVILEMNGIEINNDRDVRELLQNSDLKVGDKLELKIFRDGKILKKKVKLEAVGG